MDKEYVIGIIGGIGTGKSTVLGILRDKYEAEIIEADAVGHDLMKRGEMLYRKEVAFFGEEILDASGESDRKKLGEIVFSDKDKLKALNEMAHPAIRMEIARRLAAWRERGAQQKENQYVDSGSAKPGQSTEGKAEAEKAEAGREAWQLISDSARPGQSTEGKAEAEKVDAEQDDRQSRREADLCKGLRLAVLEAALPKEAGMLDFCDKLWVVTASLEARIKRLMDGRGYTREKCIGIISSQRSDKEFAAMADAVIDNGGSLEDTESQLDALVNALKIVDDV